MKRNHRKTETRENGLMQGIAVIVLCLLVLLCMILEGPLQSLAETQEASGTAAAQSGQSVQTGQESGSDAGGTVESKGSGSAETDSRETGSAQTQSGEKTLQVKGDDYTITVTYGSSADLPEDTTLTAEEIREGDAEYAEREAQLKKTLDLKSLKYMEFHRYFNLEFQSKGEKVEPSDDVEVKITFRNLDDAAEAEELSVVHYGAEKTEILDGDEVKTSVSEHKGTSTVKFSLSSFSYISVYGTSINVDPTNGGTALYSGAALNQTVRGTSLPTASQVTAPTKYKYVLNGWYDINARKWYKPGYTFSSSSEAAQLSGHTFYADWIPADYNIGTSSGAIDTPDTDSFITTDVFDFNDLFNANYANYANYSSSGGWSSSSGSTSPMFNDYINSSGTLANPKNLSNAQSNHETSQGKSTYGAKGIITSGLATAGNLSAYFSTENAWNTVTGSGVTNNTNGLPGKTYVGSGSGLFQYNSSNGYYYYDSIKNAASYNKSRNGFYVYNYKEYTADSAARYTSKDKPDFLPFNSGSTTYSNGSINFWFGMKTSVSFFLPNNPGEDGANQAAGGKDMIYKFSGDDDVWVYVDNKLVLDLGGIHDIVYGEINFSKGTYTIVQAAGSSGSFSKIGYTYSGDGTIGYDAGGGGLVTTRKFADSSELKSIKAGDHTLTMYYLERGASQSNASIYFNLAPRYSLNLVKHDADNSKTLLQGAKYAVYKDADCSTAENLWTSESAYKRYVKGSNDDADAPRNVFTTDENGELNAYGLAGNNDYYLKEISAPDGYPNVSDKVIHLHVDGSGNPTIVNQTEVKSLVTGVSKADGSSEIRLDAQNEKTTSVTVKKHWYSNDGSTSLSTQKVSMTLYRTTSKPDSSGTADSGITVPVSFKTQYFSKNSSGTDGSNLDQGQLKTGSYTLNTTAITGDTLNFTVSTGSKYTGIYSVSVNGTELTPVSTGSSAEESFTIKGKENQTSPVSASYSVPVSQAQNIVVTLIGSANGNESGTPSVQAITYDIASGQTGSSSGGSTGLPSDAVKVEQDKEGTASTNPVALTGSETDSWTHTWSNLPTRDADGKTYYYYVQEDTPSGYAVSYAGNGTTGGTVDVSNIQTKTLTVSKVWKNPDGSELDSASVPTDSLEFTLTQVDATGGESRNVQTRTFTLTKDSGWTRTWQNVTGEQIGHVYLYKLEEKNVPAGFTQTSSVSADPVSGNITITAVNRVKAATLPDAGGSGTRMFFLLGGACIALALLMTYIRKCRISGTSI